MQDPDSKSAKVSISEEEAPQSEQREVSELDELRSTLKQKEEQLLRTLAEFDNYRKRIAKEVEDIGKAGKRELLLGVLPVLDSFERAFQSEALRADVPVYKGMRSIHKQLQQLLDQHQVINFESIGQHFDPHFHEAVGTEQSSKHPEGVITKETLKGYLWEGKVLRPAQVIVVKQAEPQQSQPGRA
jgi:molecular chaperone GrpE